jgi:hypothetical protein
LQRSYANARPNPSHAAMPAIALERTRALDDTDGATRQTVEKMCELIRDSARDPYVQRCAAYARDRFAMGSSDPAALAWGCFWYVKHCVKFRLDEGTMLQIGESHDAYGQQQQDLLIAPAVLVRMKNPSEDCDGFTMLTAALLTCLGVPVLIATVAADLDDPTRWSHVFLCAIINGRVKPLDTSHGAAPGWMVPRNRIHRWQTWTLDGRPADVSIPTFQGLHAYQTFPGLGAAGATRSRRVLRTPLMLVPKRGRGFGRLRGMGQSVAGQDCYCDDGSEPPDCDDGSSQICTSTGDSSSSSSAVQCPDGYVNEGGVCTTADCPTGYVYTGNGVCTAPAGGTAAPTPTPNPCPAGYVYDGGSQCSTGSCPSGYIYSGNGVCTSPSGATSTTPISTASPNWAQVASAAVTAAGQDVKAVIAQPSALLNAQTWANLVAYLPFIGIAVLGVILIGDVAGGKK